MRKARLIYVALFGLAGALGGGALLLHNSGWGQTLQQVGAIGGPLPPPAFPPNIVTLTPMEQLGKDMLYDTTLSNPEGYACAQCHIPTAGFTGPSSIVNLISGPQPGVVTGRFSNRKPQSYVYAAFSPYGPVFNATLATWLGGTFWDGRTRDNAHQAQQPPINPVEMANTPTNGIYPPVFGGYPALLAQKLQSRPYTPLIKQIFGANVFTTYTPQQVFQLIFAQGVAVYQGTGEVCGFSSKYDASIYGVPPKTLYTLSASEERGRLLYFGLSPSPVGGAQCFQCHSSAALDAVLPTPLAGGRELFTMFCYANIGTPKNYGMPFYLMTDNAPGGCASNPNGCNPLGANYIDYGLGANPNPAPDGTVFNNPATNALYLGLFKTPSNRDVDLRPSPNFVKAYMHNGVHKSLQAVVHFYNTRNIAVNAAGQQFAFDLRHPDTIPPGYTRIWPPPEVLANVQNVIGYTPAQAAAAGTTGVIAENGQIGNLGLTASQEADVVNFLKILSDFYTAPNPVANPTTPYVAP